MKINILNKKKENIMSIYVYDSKLAAKNSEQSET